jgi:anti-sigma B factor antagonist
MVRAFCFNHCVSEGSGTGHEGASGIREDPVAGVDRNGSAVVVRLAGELDLYNAHAVREALLECCSEGPERLVVDLSDVSFVDSTALGVLIEARTRLANRRGFLLAAPGLEIRRALEISGLDRHFAVHDSLEAALSASL